MKIAFRADASHEIGTGHVLRCLTLADFLRTRGAETRFLCRQITGPLAQQLDSHGHELRILPPRPDTAGHGQLKHSHWLHASQRQDAEDSLDSLADADWNWVVVDHYALGASWEALLRENVARIMAIDDIADRQHDCDLLLDQNLYSDIHSRYAAKVPERCQSLLGPRYALLREEFRQQRQTVAVRTGPVERVHVSFGGVDADNYTALAIEALAALDRAPLSVDVVIGSSHPHVREVRTACAESGFSCYVQTSRMAELIAGADLAIGAGGSATWERCCLGLPTLTLPVADNQRSVAADAALAGLVYAPDLAGRSVATLTRHLQALIENQNLRAGISSRAMRAVDGRGCMRVARALGCVNISLRLATHDDSEHLFQWRNHPSIRAVSRSKNAIDRETHRRWLDSTLADPSKVLLIGTRQQAPVGVVRFDLGLGAAEVSVYLVPEVSNPGAGGELLNAAEQWLRENHPSVSNIEANVMEDNEPSHRLFSNAGYRRKSTWYSKPVSPL